MSGKEQEEDAALSAYLDGELPRDEADRIADRLAADPALARRIEELRAADAAARRIFKSIDERPLPQGVLDLLQDADASAGNGQNRAVRNEQHSAGEVIPFPARAARRFFQMPVAIAASITLVVGFLLGDLVSRVPQSDSGMSGLYAGEIPATSELHRLLESAASGEALRLASGAEGRVLLTFENESGRFCRQLGLAEESGSMQALACRLGDRWRMEAASFDAATSPGSQYAAASASSPALDAAIDAQIGDREPLSPEQERALITGGWKKTAK